MTIAALRRLIDQAQSTDTDPTTSEESPMLQPTPRPAAPAGQEQPVLSVGKLLAWAASHPEKTLRDQAERARTALDALRTRHAADLELVTLQAEEETLQRRLAELADRKAALLPAKVKKRRAAQRDYVPAEVRAWARANGHDVPAAGTIPNVIVAAWRARPDAS